MLGTTGVVAKMEGIELGNAGQLSRVQAVVDGFGPVDFLKMDSQFAGTKCSANHYAADSFESVLVGAAIQTVPDLVKTTNQRTTSAPPTRPSGTADCNVPPVQSKNFADALRQLIGADKVTYVSLEGAGQAACNSRRPRTCNGSSAS
jgi:hypothetical protein